MIDPKIAEHRAASWIASRRSPPCVRGQHHRHLYSALPRLARAKTSRRQADKKGTVAPHAIINAPSSTKNADKARDPEMHQTKKGNRWSFGMKGHFGVDSRSKLIHVVVATPANVADSTVLPNLLHGNETRVWGDQAYRGQRAVIREHAPRARDFTNRRAPKTILNPKCGPRACPRESGVRTCDRGYQAGIRLCQGALSRAQKERASPARGLCARQSVHRAPSSIALRHGVICLARPLPVADAIDVTPITTPLLPLRQWLRQFQCRISTRSSLFRPSLTQRRRGRRGASAPNGTEITKGIRPG
jgi:hypothetical protein